MVAVLFQDLGKLCIFLVLSRKNTASSNGKTFLLHMQVFGSSRQLVG